MHNTFMQNGQASAREEMLWCENGGMRGGSRGMVRLSQGSLIPITIITIIIRSGMSKSKAPGMQNHLVASGERARTNERTNEEGWS